MLAYVLLAINLNKDKERHILIHVKGGTEPWNQLLLNKIQKGVETIFRSFFPCISLIFQEIPVWMCVFHTILGLWAWALLNLSAVNKGNVWRRLWGSKRVSDWTVIVVISLCTYSRVKENIEIDVSLKCWTFKDLKTPLKIFPISDVITLALLLCWFSVSEPPVQCGT